MPSEAELEGKSPQLPSNSSPNELGSDSTVAELIGTCNEMNFHFFTI